MAEWRAASRRDLRALGVRLRRLGLSELAVTQCFGVTCPGQAPLAYRLGRRVASVPPAALLPYLFVAGADLPADRLARRLGDDWPLLVELGLVSTVGGPGAPEAEKMAHAEVAILPVGEALVVSDRADVFSGSDAALFCDDSAFHAIGTLPRRGAGRVERWLDVGCGSGILPLARPDIAQKIFATDINPRAVAMAELSAALSSVDHVAFAVGDLFAVAGESAPGDLITFNAPIPDHAANPGDGGPEASSYRVGSGDLLPRFWAEVGSFLAPGGEVLVHSWQPHDDYPASLELPGRVIAARYTPPGEVPSFGVTSWRPDEPADCTLVSVELSDEEPHLTRAAIDS